MASKTCKNENVVRGASEELCLGFTFQFLGFKKQVHFSRRVPAGPSIPMMLNNDTGFVAKFQRPLNFYIDCPVPYSYPKKDGDMEYRTSIHYVKENVVFQDIE